MSMANVEHTMVSPLADPMLPNWFNILRVRRENHDTFTLELGSRDEETNFSFAPGQFNMLYIYGVGEVPISISGDPARHDVIVHTTRAVGTVTRAMWRLKRGDTIGIRGPFGSSWPIDEARNRDIVIVTGGIGLAPLRPVISHVHRHRDDFGKAVLLYGARTPDDLLYTQEFPEWADSGRMSIDVTVDRASTGWDGKIGVVTTLIPRADFDPSNSIALVCGPEIMMRFTVKSLRELGMNTDRIYVSMERNMKCAVGFCGHCQYGPEFICKDGPVFRFDRVEHLLGLREL